MASTPTMPGSPTKRPAHWRFWLPLAIQTALILAVPAQAIYTQLSGSTVILQTGPVDPYDLLRGYYVTLSYEVSTWNTLQELPGWDEVVDQAGDPNSADPAAPLQPGASFFDAGTEFYLRLQQPEDLSAQPPQPWQPIALSLEKPTNLPENQVAIQGVLQSGRVIYGLETYYIPEDQRYEINERISQAQAPNSEQTNGRQPFVVEVKVNGAGEAVPVSLWVGNQQYRF